MQSPQDVTEAELNVLRTLWASDGRTAREIVEVAYPSGTDSDYATVKKLLSRLEGKGFIRRDRHTPAHRFFADVSRDELVSRRLSGLADSLCDGSRTPLLMQLIGDTPLSAKERQRLKSLIDELAPKPKRKGKQ